MWRKNYPGKEVIKRIGLIGLILVLSACDQLINISTSQGVSEVTQIHSSKYTPFIKAITPSPAATLEATSTPTETAEITQKPTEVIPLTDEEEIKILFEQGVNDSNTSCLLVSTEDAESFMGKDATAVSIKSVKDILYVLLSQGYSDVEIPAYADSLVPEINAQYPNASIIVRQVGADGNIVPTPKGYYAVESLGFAAGGWGSFVINPDGRILAILPKGDKNINDWQFDHVEGEVDFVNIRAQSGYGREIVFVKVPGATKFRMVQTLDGSKVSAILNWGVKVDDYTSNLWTLSKENIQGDEILFNTLNPQTTSVGEVEYKGYQLIDSYSTRLVDDSNNILLVKDGDTWRAPESRNYSEAYPAIYYETKIGNTDGFEIPVTVGLSANAQEGEAFNFTEVGMTQKGADDIAQVFLQNCWLRYKYIMNHPDVTYDQYLDLLKQGKGDIAIYDILAKKEFLIDPRRGFSLVLTAEGPGKMPLKLRYNSATGFYYGADETGRFLWANNAAWIYHMGLEADQTNVRDNNTIFLLGQLTSTVDLAIYSDECLTYGVLSACGLPEYPPEPLASDIYSTAEDLVRDYHAFNSHTSDDPLFILR